MHAEILANIGIPFKPLEELLNTGHVLFQRDAYLRSRHCARVISNALADLKHLSVVTDQAQVNHSAQDPVRLLAGQFQHPLRYVREQVVIEVQKTGWLGPGLAHVLFGEGFFKVFEIVLQKAGQVLDDEPMPLLVVAVDDGGDELLEGEGLFDGSRVGVERGAGRGRGRVVAAVGVEGVTEEAERRLVCV